MAGVIRGWMVVCVAGAVVLTAGCNDQKSKDKIAMLEDGNQRLMDENNGMRDELEAVKAERDRCQQDLLAARGDADTLRGQLATKPQVPEGWQAVPGGAMIAIEGSVLFDSGKAVLRTDGKRTLETIHETIRKTYPDKEILVYGHTDDEPIKHSGWKDNFELSAQRALAVVRLLQDRGVPGDRLVACGCGEYRPQTPNSSTTTRQKNRRVEIYAMDSSIRTAAR